MYSNLKDENFTFDDVLLVPQYTEIESRKDVNTSINVFGNEYSHPIIPSNMDTITDVDMVKFCVENKSLAILHRFMPVKSLVDKIRYLLDYTNQSIPTFGVSVGVSNEELERVEEAYRLGVRIFCIDVAHGDHKRVHNICRVFKDRYPSAFVIAGNVATEDGAKRLEESGADAVKCGIGNGSACLTRGVTGHGIPQLSAIMNCRKGTRLPIISDGGIKSPGDVVKAIALGADMVMSGYIFAGTSETPGDIYIQDGYQVKTYRGMASKEAQEDYFGAMADWKTFEGISTTVKYKGQADNILKHYLGGLRSGMTYSNARNLKELRNNANFVKVSTMTQVENDVIGGIRR